MKKIRCLQKGEVLRKAFWNKIIVKLVIQGLPSFFLSRPVAQIHYLKWREIYPQGIARLAPYFRKEWQSEQNTQAHVKINTRKKGYFPTRVALLAAGTFHACLRGLPVYVLQQFWEE